MNFIHLHDEDKTLNKLLQSKSYRTSQTMNKKVINSHENTVVLLITTTLLILNTFIITNMFVYNLSGDGRFPDDQHAHSAAQLFPGAAAVLLSNR